MRAFSQFQNCMTCNFKIALTVQEPQDRFTGSLGAKQVRGLSLFEVGNTLSEVGNYRYLRQGS